MVREVRTATIVALLGLLAGCGGWPHLRWPWTAPARIAPEAAASELVITGASGELVTAFPQYWQRNTLVIDMQSAGGAGSVTIAPRSGGTWPVRLGFRVRPGSIGTLDVRGEQRVLLPIASEGAQLIELELAPGMYSGGTERLSVTWGPTTAQSPGG